MPVAKRAVGEKKSRKPALQKTAKVRAKKAKAARNAALTPVRTAFYKRVANVVKRIADTAPEDGLVEALSAPTDVGTLARALSSSAVIGPAVREIEPLAVLIAQGVEHKQALIAEAGGLLSTAEVAALLGVSRQAVHKQRQERKLLSVPHGGEAKFPAVQFTRAGRPLPGLAQVLKAIGLEGGWGTLDFLLVPDDDELDGLSPIETLSRHPGRVDEVVQLAARQGEHGAG